MRDKQSRTPLLSPPQNMSSRLKGSSKHPKRKLLVPLFFKKKDLYRRMCCYVPFPHPSLPKKRTHSHYTVVGMSLDNRVCASQGQKYRIYYIFYILYQFMREQVFHVKFLQTQAQASWSSPFSYIGGKSCFSFTCLTRFMPSACTCLMVKLTQLHPTHMPLSFMLNSRTPSQVTGRTHNFQPRV